MRPIRTRAAPGFTLVEALIVLIMAGVVLAMALPPFAAVRRSLRLDGAAHQLAGDLRRAQVEAIKRNQSVRLMRTGGSTYDIQFIGARSFDEGVTFGPTSMDSIRMASFGPPVGGGATFTVQVGAPEKTVTVTASGLVSVR